MSNISEAATGIIRQQICNGGKMAFIGYMFLALEKELRVPLDEQQKVIAAYAHARGQMLDEVFVEQGVSLKQALINRKIGRTVFTGLQVGDCLVVARAAFILGSSREASRLLQVLREKGISLICLDLDEDISLDRERRLVVSTGGAGLVQKVLAALSICDSSRHGEAIRATKRGQKREGKYLGGPVPYGWQIGDGGYLVQNLEQQRIIREMIKLREDRWSYRDIASKVSEKHGLDLSHEGIRKVLETNARKKDEEKQRTFSLQAKPNALLQKHTPQVQGVAEDQGAKKKKS